MEAVTLRHAGRWFVEVSALSVAQEVHDEPLLEVPRYVPDSVAKWLNDASKTSPEWVRELCERWGREGVPAIDRIVGRALRILRKKGRVVSDVKRKR